MAIWLDTNALVRYLAGAMMVNGQQLREGHTKLAVVEQDVI